MLQGLTIRDVVLIDRLDLAFRPGLCVLTGETGAGKSILLDALGLALGMRAVSALVRHGADLATVSAALAPAAGHPARAILAELGLDSEDTVLLRRQISAISPSLDEPYSISSVWPSSPSRRQRVARPSWTGCSVSMITVARATGSPAAIARRQKPSSIAVSLLPARPASVIQPASSDKAAEFMIDYPHFE